MVDLFVLEIEIWCVNNTLRIWNYFSVPVGQKIVYSVMIGNENATLLEETLDAKECDIV